MAKLSEEKRDKLPKEKFAYVDSKGEGHLPIHDEEHIRNALSRWNQTAFESAKDKDSARKKILKAAREHGIDVSGGDKVKKAA